jgi:hypothetical protein
MVFSFQFGVDVVAWQIIENFKKCHEDHPVQKFFGVCNDLKIELDRCFREEVGSLSVFVLRDS